jgi:DNA-binding FadR family transcriptional regulator
VGDLQEARVLIEAPAAARLAGTSPDTIGRLREIHDGELAELDDPAGFLSALSTFERAVFEIAGNKTIEVLSSIFRDIVNAEASIRGSLPRRSQVRTKLAALQSQFIDTIAEGDGRRAMASWSEYLRQTAKLISRGARSEPLDVVPVWRAQITSDRNGTQSSKMAPSIATEIRIGIARGKIKEGDLLPPMPELVNRFGVSRPTMREALRILEMEGLVDLRTGSRSGARVFEPTAEKAAHLAGLILESAQTRMGDVAEARRLIEPGVMELAATGIDEATLSNLSKGVQVLKGMVEDTPSFVPCFEDLEQQVFSAIHNPAISVGVEVMTWVANRCRTALTVSALTHPQVAGSNRRTCRSFEAFIEAARKGDGEAAAAIWAKHLDEVSPFFRPPLGDRLIVDLFD